MGHSSRSHRDHVPRPSPLATVEYARPLSTLSSLNRTPNNAGGDGRQLSVLPESLADDDTEFWRRFDVATAASEASYGSRGRGMMSEADEEMMHTPRQGSMSTDRERVVGSTMDGGSVVSKSRDEWLTKQRKKRRKAHLVAWSIGLILCGLLVMAAVLGWYYGSGGPSHHSRRDDNPTTATADE